MQVVSKKEYLNSTIGYSDHFEFVIIEILRGKVMQLKYKVSRINREQRRKDILKEGINRQILRNK